MQGASNIKAARRSLTALNTLHNAQPFAGIQLRQAADWGGEANAGVSLLVSRMGHQGAGDAAVAEVSN